jgi:hypothetical protein
MEEDGGKFDFINPLLISFNCFLPVGTINFCSLNALVHSAVSAISAYSTERAIAFQ